jgi:phage baseplate assembly protein W
LTDYGTDISTPNNDLDPYFRLVSERETLRQSLARAVTTSAGSLFWAPDRGINLRDYLNDGLDEGEAARLSGLIASQLERDERVLAAQCEVTFLLSTQTLIVKSEIDTADGPFDLVFNLNDANGNLNVTVINV